MVTALPFRTGRAGAISASTVFAVVMAIVAGLIFTLVFKTVVLDKKPLAGPAAATMKRMTVAARNIRDKSEIRAADVKFINVSDERYKEIMNGSQAANRKYLDGAKPIGRTTVKVINAEEPIFDDQCEPFSYPDPVSSKLRQGMRAVVVEVPANSAMIQVGDHVDVLATLAHDSPLARNAEVTTAALAKNLRVVARFNSTRTAAPPNPGPKRTYTLEATPYRAAILELAKNMGCAFNLPVSPRRMNEEGGTVGAAPDSGMDDPMKDRVTVEDLANIFGVKPPPEPQPVWEVQRYTGVARGSSLLFPNYKNPSDKDKNVPAAGQPGSGAKPAVNVPPAPPNKPPVPRNPIVPTATQNPPRRSASLPGLRSIGSGSGVVASASGSRSNSYGFRPPPAARQSQGCQSCGK